MAGLELSNITNLDKDKPTKVSQSNSFTVTSPEAGNCIEDGAPCENIHITGFEMYMVGSMWRYKLIKWLVKKLKGRTKYKYPVEVK